MMDPEIDVDAVAINAAAEVGRSGGLDWAPSLTFDTGEEAPRPSINVKASS